MARSTPPTKLDALAELLERTGGDARRLEAVKRAQRFKRSWVELGEVLVALRRSRAFERWGFTDFHEYCAQELLLKRATVDKLVVSYGTLERHAPEVLQRDGIAQAIPSVQAVDYFARALRDEADTSDAGDELDEDEEAKPARRRGLALAPRPDAPVDELRAAVFDEGVPVTELRRRFDPEFFPKPKGAEQLATVKRARQLARKLAELLPDIAGLAESRRAAVDKALGALRVDLDELAGPLEAKVERAQARGAAAPRRTSRPAPPRAEGPASAPPAAPRGRTRSSAPRTASRPGAAGSPAPARRRPR